MAWAPWKNVRFLENSHNTTFVACSLEIYRDFQTDVTLSAHKVNEYFENTEVFLFIHLNYKMHNLSDRKFNMQRIVVIKANEHKLLTIFFMQSMFLIILEWSWR